jgi:hypothetical protein
MTGPARQPYTGVQGEGGVGRQCRTIGPIVSCCGICSICCAVCATGSEFQPGPSDGSASVFNFGHTASSPAFKQKAA